LGVPGNQTLLGGKLICRQSCKKLWNAVETTKAEPRKLQSELQVKLADRESELAEQRRRAAVFESMTSDAKEAHESELEKECQRLVVFESAASELREECTLLSKESVQLKSALANVSNRYEAALEREISSKDELRDCMEELSSRKLDSENLANKLNEELKNREQELENQAGLFFIGK
jgi:chromosome segregation ATPase